MTTVRPVPSPLDPQDAARIAANQAEALARAQAKVAHRNQRIEDLRRQASLQRMRRPPAARRESRTGLLSMLFGLHETRRRALATSTTQAEAVLLAAAEPSLGNRGSIIGKELYSGQAFVYDPFELYGDDLPGPNVLTIGDVGGGKSVGWKVYAMRQVRLGRQVAVLDSKDQQGQGEWAPIARAHGWPVVAFSRRGGVRINPLDPRIVRGRIAEPDGRPRREAKRGDSVGQDALLRTIAEIALDRPLSPEEGYALRAAHEQALDITADGQRDATLPDVVAALFAPTQAAAERTRSTQLRLVEDGRKVALELDRMVTGDVAGLIDGPTTLDVDLDAPMVVFDLSQLDHEGPSLPIVMAIIGTFLQSAWVRPDGRKRLFIVEEGWHVIGNLSTVRLFRRLYKLARGLGLQNIAVVHHLSDVEDGADGDRRAAVQALVKEAQTIVVYRQDAEETRAVARRLGLSKAAVALIPELPRGCALWKIGRRVRPVQVIVTDYERELVFTNAAMQEE